MKRKMNLKFLYNKTCSLVPDKEEVIKSPQAVGILFCVYDRKLSVEIFDNFLSETLQHNHKLTHSCNVRYSKELHFETVTLPEIQSAESHVLVCYRLSLIKQLLITNWRLNGDLNVIVIARIGHSPWGFSGPILQYFLRLLGEIGRQLI